MALSDFHDPITFAEIQAKFSCFDHELPHTIFLCRDNLEIVKDLGDRAALGRAYGSLGNTNYLLGNYRDAIRYHREVSELVNVLKKYGL